MLTKKHNVHLLQNAMLTLIVEPLLYSLKFATCAYLAY